MNWRKRRHRRHRCPADCPALIPLSELPIGREGRVVKICCQRSNLRRRMLDMGITCGTVVRINRRAPLGDPIDICVRGYHLCLRSNDLAGIMVEVL